MHFIIAKTALMETETLQIFIQVADSGGFTAAARRLGADPSLISRTIAHLERELGFQLFHRTTRKIALTAAGAAYLEHLSPLMDGLKQAEEAARNQTTRPEGLLTLTASTAFGQTCILPHVAEFRQRYPGVRLNLRFTDAVLDIIAEQVDLACRLTSNADPNLVGRKLFSTCFWVCASPSYLKMYGHPVRPSELNEHRIMAMNLAGYRERWLFRSSSGEIGKAVLQPDMLLSNALAMHEMTVRGLGISLLASWLVEDDLREGRLVRLFTEHEVAATDFQSAAWLLYPSRKFLPAKTRAMVDFLCEKYRC